MTRTAFRNVVFVLTLVAVACGGGQASPPPRTVTKPAEVDLSKPEEGGDVAAPRAYARTGSGGPTSDAVPVSADDAVWGSPTAPVTIVVFTDFQCPFCSRAHATVTQLEQTYGPQKLRIVFKHNPLPFHPNAMPAALAAQSVLRVGGPQAFFAYADKLFRGQQNLDDQNLLQWASEVGVERGALLRNASSPEVRAKVEADQALAGNAGLNGTPSFLINGSELVGAQPFEKFKDMVDSELRETAALRSQGVGEANVYAQRVARNFKAPQPEAPAGARPPATPEPTDTTTVWKVPVGKSPTLGPVTAPVTIVEFSDYQCPFCKRVQPTLKELVKRYPNKIRLVFKHNPLPFHPRGVPAAIFASEVRAQRADKGFWQATDLLFAKAPRLEDEDFLDLAKEMKINEARVKTALSKGSYKGSIQDDQDLADDLDARGTPTFFINGRKLSGAQSLETFSTLVDQELAKAEERIKKGTPAAQVYTETIKDGRVGNAPESAKSTPLVTKENPSRGPAKAPVTIQVFSDFQCPFCKRAAPTIAEIEKAFPGRVRIVWRNMPLSFHREARPAAYAAMEAFALGGNKAFWKYHDLLFAQQERGLDPAALETQAAKAGLDASKIRAAVEAKKHEDLIRKDEDAAKAAGVSGTPAFVINGYYVSGAQPLGKFKKVVQRALDDAKQGKKAP